jgi:hypothetical protein
LECSTASLTSFAPLVRKEFSNLVVGHRGQTPKNISEIFLRINTVTAAALNDGVDDSATPTRVRVNIP